MRAYIADPGHPAGMSMVDVAEPVASRPDHVIIQVVSTSVNRGEVTRMQAWAPGRVLGWDLAGYVRAPAADGSGPVAGTAVFGWTNGTGSWAEQAAVATSTIEPMPEGLSFAAASAIGVAGVTALFAVRRGGSLLGRHVIVTGAAGGVGRMAVQLAVEAGARVTAIASERPDRVAAVKSLGLPGVRIEHQLVPDGDRAHLIVESVGGMSLEAALRRVAHGGCVVTLGRASGEQARVPPDWFYRNARLEGLEFRRDAAVDVARPSALTTLGDLVANGKLDPGIGWEDDWARMPEAVGAVLARRVSGRAVLRISSPDCGGY
jgi:NADPH:quinone reductase